MIAGWTLPAGSPCERGLQPAEPLAFDLLLCLIEKRERVVTRDELLERVWHGRIVTEATLSSRIRSARQVIGDKRRDRAFIRTFHSLGFRFVGAVRVVDVDRKDQSEPMCAGSAKPVAQGATGGANDLSAAVTLVAPVANEAWRPGATAPGRRPLTIVRCSVVDSSLALGERDPEQIDAFLQARAIVIATFEGSAAISPKPIRPAFQSTSAGREPTTMRRMVPSRRRLRSNVP